MTEVESVMLLSKYNKLLLEYLKEQNLKLKEIPEAQIALSAITVAVSEAMAKLLTEIGEQKLADPKEGDS